MSTATATEERNSWIPMIAIALGQAIMSFNVASLPVAMGGMVESFGTPPTTVATGIVVYSMIVSGFVTSPDDQSRICFDDARPIRIEFVLAAGCMFVA